MRLMSVVKRLLKFESIKKWFRSQIISRYHVMMNYVNYYKKESLYVVDLRNGKESKNRLWFIRLPLQYITGLLCGFDDYYDVQIGIKRGIIGWLVYYGWYARTYIGNALLTIFGVFETDKYRILHDVHWIADKIVAWQSNAMNQEFDEKTGKTKYYFEWVDEDNGDIMYEEIPDPEKYWEDFHLGKLPDDKYNRFYGEPRRFII